MGIFDIYKTQSPQQKYFSLLEKAGWEVKEDKHAAALSYYREAESLLTNFNEDYNKIAIAFYYLFADSYRLTGQTKKAETEIKKAYDLDSGNEYTLLSYGWIKLELEEYKEAIDLLDSCIRLNPENSEGYFYRGVCYIELGKLELALVDFIKSTEINPKYKEGFFNVGKTYQRMKKHEEAIPFYDKAIALEPLYSGAYVSRGVCNIELGQKEKACTDFKQALDLGDEKVQANINEFCKN